MTFWGTLIIVTTNRISIILHVRRVVAHLDHPSCDRFRTVSRDELLSHFCERPSIWGGKQNTLYIDFAKGPCFLNMVMTFTLTPLSHYNSIIKPRALFLLSLLEDLSIDFPTHFITPVLNVYHDMATRDKLIFPFAILHILQHFSIEIPDSPHLFSDMSAINTVTIRRSEAQIQLKWPRVELKVLQLLLSLLLLHLLPRLVMWSWRPLWRNFSAWMLALTLSLMSCVKWPLMSVV